MQRILFSFFLAGLLFSIRSSSQTRNDFVVMAYYADGNFSSIDSFHIEKVTHLIFSFCHLKANKLNVDNAADTAVIHKLVALKKRNPSMKVILSLGGWGGCETCSDVFSTKQGRSEFSVSVKQLNDYFKTDGLDLDWEYPTVVGYPGHKYQPADKENFTELVKELRKTLGKTYEICFAAGGYNEYLDNAVDWKKVMKEVDHVNLMTYDLVNGYSTK